jgi:hypothetical protein
LGSLALQPGDSLTIPQMALSIGFMRFVSSAHAIQATGFLTFALVGLSPLNTTANLLFFGHAGRCCVNCVSDSLADIARDQSNKDMLMVLRTPPLNP